MEEGRHSRVSELFLLLADSPPATWRKRLEELCGNDTPLGEEVLRLLEQDTAADTVLDRELGEVAGNLLDDDAGDGVTTRRVGAYRLVRPLGEGGMGVVYLAERDDLSSVAAVKLLRDGWLSPERRERFLMERRTLAQLNHPGVAKLFDADTLPDGTPWFAMEYVEGIAVTDYCTEEDLGLDERLRVLLRICEAVQYAHSRAVIHRDLKPSNILAKADGTVRLLDFGVARQIEERGREVERTRTGLRMLTPAWASPELLRGEMVGVQCDVFSLGVILFQMLTGSLPGVPREDGGGEFAVGGRRPSEAEPTGNCVKASRAQWADLDVLCISAMHPDLGRRYASVEAFARDIEHYLRGEALEARPDSWVYRTRKFLARNRRAVLAATAAGILIASVIALFTWRLALAREDAVGEARRAQRVQEFLFRLLRGGDELAGPTADLRVATLLDEAVREAEALRADPEMQAELYQNLGSVYQHLGDYERAEDLLERALAMSRTPVERVRALAEKSVLRATQARLAEAEELATQAHLLAEQHLAEGHPERARARNALAAVHIEKGGYAQAVQVLQAAVGGREEGVDAGASVVLLANAHFYMGGYAESRALNLRVLSLRRAAYGDAHPTVADIVVNLGAVAFEQGDYAEAEARYREALAVVERWFGEEHPRTASVLTMLGRVLIRAEQRAAAGEVMRRSLEIQRRVHGERHPAVASAWNELGTLALLAGDYAEAESSFRRVGEIYRRAMHEEEHYLHGIAASNMGSVYLGRGDFARAEGAYRNALAIFQRTVGKANLNTGIARLKLGRALLRRGDLQGAEEQIQQGREVIVTAAGEDSPWLKAASTDLEEILRQRRGAGSKPAEQGPTR